MAETFTIKDSGQREQFDSGMVRDIQGDKPRYDLALDGPLFFSVLRRKFPKYARLLLAAQDWYEKGGVERAATVVIALSEEGETGDQLLNDYAEHLRKGAIKYSERNWMKANGWAEYYRFQASFCRHLKQYIFGERDEDHRSAIVFNMNGAEYVHGRLSIDKQPVDLWAGEVGGQCSQAAR